MALVVAADAAHAGAVEFEDGDRDCRTPDRETGYGRSFLFFWARWGPMRTADRGRFLDVSRNAAAGEVAPAVAAVADGDADGTAKDSGRDVTQEGCWKGVVGAKGVAVEEGGRIENSRLEPLHRNDDGGDPFSEGG